MGRPQMSGGYNRFQYGGYSFGYNQGWPVGWGYNDNFYVVYVNGAYYLCDTGVSRASRLRSTCSDDLPCTPFGAGFRRHHSAALPKGNEVLGFGNYAGGKFGIGKGDFR